MSYINKKPSAVWIKNNHPENGLFRVYWKDVKNPHYGGATLDPDEGEGLRYEWYYKNGQMADGKSFGYFPDGRLKQIRKWKDGKLDGLWIEYYDDGTKYSRAKYKDGESHGLATEWYNNGLKKEEVLWENGKIISIKRWKENVPIDYILRDSI